MATGHPLEKKLGLKSVGSGPGVAPAVGSREEGVEARTRGHPHVVPAATVAPVTAGVFRELYDRTFEEVYSYLYHRCARDHAIAEDLTQETYLAAVRVIRADDDRAFTLPWLIAVARNKLIDHYRRREREQRRFSVLVGEEERQAAGHRNGQVSHQRALDALGSVPAEQRAVLVLKYLDGLPVSEIAVAIGKSVHATESLLARGRRTLKRRFLESTDD